MPRDSVGQRNGVRSFENSTHLDTERLRSQCLSAVDGWRLDGVTVRVRYSRGADFSGSCYYATGRIFVNLGRHLSYPYEMGTSLARAQTQGRRWWKPIYTISLASGYEVVLFVFLHECFHLLVKRARRNVRRKESMCDRFAARLLVDRFGAVVRDGRGHAVPRADWDFQDLDGFIAATQTAHRGRPRAIRAARGVCPTTPRAADHADQLWLFHP